MAEDEPTETKLQTLYTFSEAIEYMKMKDEFPTNLGETIRWVDVKTKKQVVIGYT